MGSLIIKISTVLLAMIDLRETDLLVGDVKGDGGLLEEGVTGDDKVYTDVGTDEGEDTVSVVVCSVRGGRAEGDVDAAERVGQVWRAAAVVRGDELAVLVG